MSGASVRRFAYRFIDAHGAAASAEVEAFSRGEASGKIKARGHFAIELREAHSSHRAPAGPKASPAAIQLLVGQIARLLGASVQLERALELVASDEGARVGSIAAAVRARLRAGAPLIEAFADSPDAFDVSTLALIRAGESSGDLAGAFAEIEKLLAKQNALRNRLRSAMIYPAAVLVTAIGAVLMILLQVIPQFESLVADNLALMPLSARIVFALSSAVRSGWPVIVFGLGIGGVIVAHAARAGQMESLTISVLRRAPYFGATLQLVGPARLARLLGTLLARNVPLMEAFQIASASVSAPELAAALRQGRAGLQRGLTLRGALDDAAIPPILLQLLKIGEETGKVGPMLLHAADLLDERIDRSMQQFLMLSQPIMLITIGLFVGGLLYGLFSAILAINNSIS